MLSGRSLENELHEEGAFPQNTPSSCSLVLVENVLHEEGAFPQNTPSSCNRVLEQFGRIGAKQVLGNALHTCAATLVDGSAPEKRRSQSMANILPSDSPGRSSKRRCHRGARSEASKDSKLLSSQNRYCEGSAKSLFVAETLHILFYNVRGLLSHAAELQAAIRVSSIVPAIVCLNETFLDKSIEAVS